MSKDLFPLLQPVVALLIWSLVIWVWMLVTRIPAMVVQKVVLDPNVLAQGSDAGSASAGALEGGQTTTT